MTTGFNIIGLFDTAGVAAIITGFISLFAFFVKSRREDKNKDDATKAALRVLLEIEIKNYARRYIERGYIDIEELEELERMNAVYHDDLNGNGFIKSVMTQCEKLPNKAA